MVQFNVTDPQANQILVWSELENAFINVDHVENNIILGGSNIGNQGSNIFHDVAGGNLRFKSIVAGDGLAINEFNTHIELVSTGTASSLNGFSSTDFMKTENPFSDINVSIARDNLDVYSTTESNALFMETNASNLPDSDNVYDLGSNGRRYAGVYAYTFHGTATNASLAEQLNRNNAIDGQVLTWNDSTSRWIPSNPIEMSISNATDVYTDTLQDRSILRFNANRNRWEPELFEIGTGGSGGIADIENLGNGLAIYKNRTGFIANYRTLRSGTNINLRYNFNDDEIVIDANVPQNTDELVEGTNNLYYTNQRFTSAFNASSVTSLNDVQSGTPNINQGLLWNGTEFRFRNLAVDINSSNDIAEGNANLYFTEQRTIDVIQDYIATPGITFNELKDINVTPTTNHIIIGNGSNWISREITLNDLSDVDVNNLENFDTIVWNTLSNSFNATKLPETLIELNETVDSQHFNDSSFSSKINGITTDDIIEGANNFYLTDTRLLSFLSDISINELIDVNIQGISNNDVLIWDAVNQEFSPTQLSDVINNGVSSIFELDEIDFTIIDINDGEILSWDSASSTFVTANQSDELSTLNDVTISNLTSGDTLKYNGSAFVNSPSLPFELTTVGTGQILSWDGSKFVNIDFSDLGGIDIAVSDLSDVSININDINEGDSLVWNDTISKFVLGPSAQSLSIVDLNGMDIDAIQLNQSIRWNGVDFEPTNIPFFNATDLADGNVLSFSSVDGSFISQDKWEHLDVDYTTPVNNALFVYDDTDNNFKVRELSIDNLSDVVVPEILTDDGDYILKWSEINSTFEVYEPRIIVDVINDLNDVSINDLQDGDLISWNSTSSLFENKPFDYPVEMLSDVTLLDIADNHILLWNGDTAIFENELLRLNSLDDVFIENLSDGDTLIWDNSTSTFVNGTSTTNLRTLNDVDIQPETLVDGAVVSYREGIDSFVSSNELINIGGINYNSNEWFAPYDDGTGTIIESGYEYDEFLADYNFHVREVTADTEFKIRVRNPNNAVQFLNVNLINPDNYNVSFIVVTEDNSSDVQLVLDTLNDISFNGDTIVSFSTSNGLTWKMYSAYHPIGGTLPSFETDTVSNKDVFIYNDTAEIMESRNLDVDDISGLPETKNNGDVLVWDETTSAYLSSKELSDVRLNSTFYSVSETTTANINVLSSEYILLTPTIGTDYILDDITIPTQSAYKCVIVLDNPNDYTLTFAATTGNIEYIGTPPANLNGKYLIDVLTLDGINWILKVSDEIA